MKKLYMACAVVDEKVVNIKDMVIKLENGTEVIIPTVSLNYNPKELKANIIKFFNSINDYKEDEV